MCARARRPVPLLIGPCEMNVCLCVRGTGWLNFTIAITFLLRVHKTFKVSKLSSPVRVSMCARAKENNSAEQERLQINSVVTSRLCCTGGLFNAKMRILRGHHLPLAKWMKCAWVSVVAVPSALFPTFSGSLADHIDAQPPGNFCKHQYGHKPAIMHTLTCAPYDIINVFNFLMHLNCSAKH